MDYNGFIKVDGFSRGEHQTADMIEIKGKLDLERLDELEFFENPAGWFLKKEHPSLDG